MRPESVERIKSWLNGNPAPPFHLEISLTNNCNLNCIACRARGKCVYVSEEENKMTLEIYKELLSEAKKLGVEEIHLTGGGEPLMYKHIAEVMKEIKKNSIIGSIVTNGSLFNENLIKELIFSKWDNVLYSLDGPNAETHDFLREKGIFDKVAESIKLFNFYKKKYKQEQPIIELCLVLSRFNYDKLLAYLQLASSLGIKKIFVQPIRVKDNSEGKKLILTEEQKHKFQESIPLILEKSDELGISTNLDALDELLIKKSCKIKEVISDYSKKKKKNTFSSLPCYSPWYFMGIRPNGDVYPCGVDSHEPFGSIITEALEDIWYRKKFESFRKRLLSKKIPNFCAECCGMSVLITKDIQNRI